MIGILGSKLAAENPTFAAAHSCSADAYWARSMYPQVIAEWKAYSQLTGNPWDTKWADALDQGFHSGGWKGALTNGIEVRKAQRQAGYFPGDFYRCLLCPAGGQRSGLPLAQRRPSRARAQPEGFEDIILLDGSASQRSALRRTGAQSRPAQTLMILGFS